MITQLETQKLVIISDLHLGNPFSRTKKKTIEFIRWASAQGYDICINGDGLEIAQVSFNKLAHDVPEVFRALRDTGKYNRQTYYVVGNHDMALENFLEDWGSLKMAPFLNVTSGNKRIRIEHGHLYDPFFVKYPDLYEFATRLAGIFLAVHPSLYKLWIKIEEMQSYFRRASKREVGLPGEDPSFFEAVCEILNRGFDTVIFGHTHHAGVINFDNGKSYFNSGSWLIATHYVEIDNGNISLKRYDEAI